MRKWIGVLFSIFILLAGFAPTALGADAYEAQLEASGAPALWDLLPADAVDLLEGFGLTPSDFTGILRIAPGDFASAVLNLTGLRFKAHLKTAVRLMGVLIFVSLSATVLPSDDKISKVIQAAGAAALLLMLAPTLISAVHDGVAVVATGCRLQLAFVPVMAGIIAASGNGVSAYSYQSIALAVGQILNSFMAKTVLPCAGAVLGLGFVNCVDNSFHLDALAGFLKKTVIGLFSTVASLFAAFLRLKDSLAGAADTVANKGVKMLVGGIPVVGSAFSEAYGTILGSLQLVRGTVGGFGVLALVAVHLPVLAELITLLLCVRLCGLCAQMLDHQTAHAMLASVGDAVTVFLVCILFEMVMGIICTGLVVRVKTGV